MVPLKSYPGTPHAVTQRLTGGTLRHACAVLLAYTFLASSLYAQTGSISSVSMPTFGATVFDAAGDAYSIGSGPVTPGAAQTQNGGGTCEFSNGFFDYPAPCSDAYIGKVNSAGTLVWGTYLGGPTNDDASAIAVDAAGNVYITGATVGQFPTTSNAAIPSSSSATAFAAKISADGSTVLYSTYLPSTAFYPAAIALDPQGNAYIAGTSRTGHAFVLKLSADGSTFDYNVPLAGSNQDAALAIAVDSSGNAVVAGKTESPDFPVSAGVLQSRLAGVQNVFVARLNAGGAVVFSTYLGGSGTDSPSAVQFDSAGNLYVAGQTSSPNFPTTAGSFQPNPLVPLWNNSLSNGFVTRISADGSALAWSTYVMSSNYPVQAGVTQLAVTPAGAVYAAGIAGAGFPVTPSAPQICFQGNTENVYVVHLGPTGAILDATYAGQNVVESWGLAVTSGGTVLLASSSGSTQVTQVTFGGAGSAASACLSPAILNSATFAVSATGSFGVAAGEFITLTGFGLGPDTGAVYQPGAQGQIPAGLAGVQVLFDGQAAPVLYAQSRQINTLAPVELSGKTQTTITVSYNQTVVGSIAANVLAFGVPGIFRFQPGASTEAAAVNEDGTVNGPSNPAAAGSVVSLWGTGFGTLDPPCATGGLNPPGAVNLAAGLGGFITWNNEQQSSPLYVGGAPTLPCGVEQINVTVPAYSQPGSYPFLPTSTQNRGDGSLNVNQANVGATIFIK